jgi:group I intron endonuclease
MYGKTHTLQSKNLVRIKRKKYLNGIGMYDLNNNLIKSFDYETDLANYLNISKFNVSKYLNKGLVYNNKYYFKVNPL